MTASVTELTVTAEDRRVAWLATAAVALSLVDAAIPSPLPGVKPGLANIVTLVVLIRYGWATAVWVSGLRVLAGSLLLGISLFLPGKGSAAEQANAFIDRIDERMYAEKKGKARG